MRFALLVLVILLAAPLGGGPAAILAQGAPPSGTEEPAAPIAGGRVPETAPAPSGPAVAPPAGRGGAGALPHDLSVWGMFLAADLVVKAVMLGLAFASVLTWTVWGAKTVELALAFRRARALLDRVAASRSLSEAEDGCRGARSDVAVLVGAATEERERSAGLDAAGLKERVALRLERLEAAAGRRMARGTGLLATIGSTAPFVGLFGTVWGIMNSFIGISRAQTTNLAVVAPGIAEALLATAIGLVAAIPAVVIFNLFARAIGGYRLLLGHASAEVLRHVSRDADRLRPARLRAAE